jgi:hypothetical protein
MARVQDTAHRRSGRHQGNARPIDDTSVTVHVPIAFRHRRGRKVIVAPDGTGAVPQTARPSPGRFEVTPAARALARAFRWRRLIETSAVNTVNEIAAAENINPSYVSRVLRLTLLAPGVVEELMAAGVEDGQSLDRLMCIS